jgi:error-prone DNA polymerase
MTAPKSYAELMALSNFSFLRGASHPEELIAQAQHLGLEALGVADINSLAGVVRAHVAAKHSALKLLIGARIIFNDNYHDIIFYPLNYTGYKSLSRLISHGKMRASKGNCELYFQDIFNYISDSLAIIIPKDFDQSLLDCQHALRTHLGENNCYIASYFTYDGFSESRIAALIDLEKNHGVHIVACNDVIAHHNSRRPLADILSCIREHKNLERAANIVQKNAERHLKSPEEMWRIFSARPNWLKNTVSIAKKISFSLDELSISYPSFSHESGLSDQDYLEQESWLGAKRRYGEKIPAKVEKSLSEELLIVKKLGYAPYFLTVYDIINFARSKNILCQGRGSAANSVICFVLAITEVDPMHADLLFGRFISEERNEPPDIDVDFENSQREQVMQYIYNKYGRSHAAITATVICFRKRLALRETAKAFGLSLDSIDALIKAFRGISLNDCAPKTLYSEEHNALFKECAQSAGLSDESRLLGQILFLARELIGFPRHLGQHVGGFVINHEALNNLVPIGNASMPGRSFIEWDKDDLDNLKILKIDILALGMLSAIKRCFQLIEKHFGHRLTLACFNDKSDKNIYDMLSKADSLGVFQVESRAQMSMLPRLKPRCFYDLVIEVAIIRPGPIQGDMVQPYLRRRNGQEKPSYPSKELEAVLKKTLGVPLFQEQVMQIAVIAANFSAGEADELRRSMATFKRLGRVNSFHERFINGMVKNNYSSDFAQSVFKQILGFAEYGFPESHAASFANLVYVSAWLKFYYPEAFAAALLNSQPMGFYAAAQIIADARRHNVELRPLDVNSSFYENSLEKADTSFALRLGLKEIRGLSEDEALLIIGCRPLRGYKSIQDLHQKSFASLASLRALNRANALASFGINEREAEWQILALDEKPLPLLAQIEENETQVNFRKLSSYDRVLNDYAHSGFSLFKHPMEFLRSRLSEKGYLLAKDLPLKKHESRVKVAGLVIIRQRPATAKGVIFFTLEDESGLMNIVIWPSFLASHRKEVLLSPIVALEGRLEIKDNVHHIITEQIYDISPLFQTLKSKSRDFR